MEEAVWEELTNTPSLSTTTSLQLANERGITIKTIPSTYTLAQVQRH